MAKLSDYYTLLEPGYYFHIYNRSVNGGDLFVDRGNYDFFLRRYDSYLSDFVETYAFCLLKNHFHLLIRVREWAAILTTFESKLATGIDLTTFQKLSNLGPNSPHSDVISHQFQKFFQSYAMAFNKQQGRYGTLFQTPFKRSRIDTDAYLTQVIYYIHANPQKHGIIQDFRTYEWSSYHRIIESRPSKLCKADVLNWFGGEEPYLRYHEEKQDFDSREWVIE
ncbi:MAG: hypothetical protein LH606_11340 [Cytophagaceae bacterium]|nr:hypothetical protein [Cytophagaceae bacterium]